MKPVLIQIIGIIATIFIGYTYTKNDKKKMLILMILASTLFSIHYFLLGALSGALFSLIVAIRSIIYLKYDKNNYSVIIFILIFLMSGIYTWKGIYSIFPLFGSILFSLAFWLKTPKNIRIISSLGSLSWGIYSIFVGSIGGILTEVFCLSSIIYGYIKYDCSELKLD